MDNKLAKYDVFALNSYEKNGATKLYKLLIADKTFSRHDDSIRFCDTSVLKKLYADSQYNFCNLTLDKNKSVWLSCCKPSIKETKVLEDKLILGTPSTIWEFLWDVFAGATLTIDNEIILENNICFGTISSEIRVQTKTAVYTIWSPLAEDTSLKPIQIKSSSDFYNKWKCFVGDAGHLINTADRDIFWEISLWKLDYKYKEFYAPCRFYIEELQYLLEKYFLTVSRLRGIEVGYWLMNKLNNINYSPITFDYFSDKECRNNGSVVYYFDVNVPGVTEYCDIFSSVKDVYNIFTKASDMDIAFTCAKLKYGMPYNHYYKEFLLGFLSQISLDQNIVCHLEHDAAVAQQNIALSLAERIFAYKFSKVWNAACDIHIQGGILQIGVLNES